MGGSKAKDKAEEPSKDPVIRIVPKITDELKRKTAVAMEKKQKKASKDADGIKQELKIEPVDEFDAMITDNKDSNQKLADRIEKKKKLKGNEITEKELKIEPTGEPEKLAEGNEETSKPTTSDRFSKYDLQFCTSPKES